MSHQVETMAYAGETPWHGLGRRVSDDMTVDEMMVAAGLDWTVSQRPLFYAGGADGLDVFQVPDKLALVRDSDQSVLTITSTNWNPVQNAEALGFMRKYVEAGGASLETAGSLKGGRIVWCLANLKHAFEVRPGDKVKGYLLMTSSHEVGRATSAKTTAVRVVCRNTLDAANSASGTVTHYRQDHTSAFDLEAAQAAVEAAHENLAACEARCKVLAGLKLSVEDAIEKVYAPVLYADEIKDPEWLANLKQGNRPARITALVDSLLNAPGAEPGTGWGTLNGFTHWADHVSGRGEDARMTSATFGTNAVAKRAIEDRLLELAA